ncbi:MAG: DUF4982 domain-containing protein [Bacteroidales bacterium]|nr:DUF4982 domain-containing protein [Bacteroidales bacterium]
MHLLFKPIFRRVRSFLIPLGFLFLISCVSSKDSGEITREIISINEDWRFMKYDSDEITDQLIYDLRPANTEQRDDKVADSKPTEAIEVKTIQEVLKPWILPTANKFIINPAKHHLRPEGNPGSNFPFVQKEFDDSSWENVNLPHDWGITGAFLEGLDAAVGGGMGRLASHGVAWYRKKLDIPASDSGKSFFLDIDGAMSYAIVWLNDKLIGGWPYGYNSWRLDLTPFILPGEVNQLAIRIDNPPASARWYPGGGIYRNIWLVKTNPVHVGQWGAFITSRRISKSSATIDIAITIDNDSETDHDVEIITKIYSLNNEFSNRSQPEATFPTLSTRIPAGASSRVEGSVKLKDPMLWGPLPTQKPNLYKAVTLLYLNGKPADQYETRFGIRSLDFDPDKGILVNGEHIPIKGVNQHHDLGALGAAFNKRAAERQLEILQEMGCNAIRMAHNPPAPELLELTDRMGFLVINEIFDSWERKKTDLDFHLVFPDWHEPDLRAFVRRDRNCPSVIIWSFGNEVGEQYTEEEGAALGKLLYDIVKEEDPSRPATAAMNFAKPDMPFPRIMDIISLNYQGEGIRDAPAYSELEGIRTSPQYPSFHEKFSDKVILSSETASALSTRGTYLFPVHEGVSAPARDGSGGDPETKYVSAYEIYTAAFGSSADKVFASQDKHPFVAGEFVWTGWDYLGEPTPYYLSRSSYSGIIDLAGFKKDRFYLYQSRWRPELPMAHILPHWNWPERLGMITPVHVFTSGDEAELFLNGKSLGKKKKAEYEYRLRWDSVKYEPGELKIISYKNGEVWAENIVKTTDNPLKLDAVSDRTEINADGKDLSFITVKIKDKNGLVVPTANNLIEFSIEGPGEIIATDNGDPSNMTPFHSKERAAFNGFVLAIVSSVKGEEGVITVTARSDGLEGVSVEMKSR